MAECPVCHDEVTTKAYIKLQGANPKTAAYVCIQHTLEEVVSAPTFEVTDILWNAPNQAFLDNLKPWPQVLAKLRLDPHGREGLQRYKVEGGELASTLALTGWPIGDRDD